MKSPTGEEHLDQGGDITELKNAGKDVRSTFEGDKRGLLLVHIL